MDNIASSLALNYVGGNELKPLSHIISQLDVENKHKKKTVAAIPGDKLVICVEVWMG